MCCCKVFSKFTQGHFDKWNQICFYLSTPRSQHFKLVGGKKTCHGHVLFGDRKCISFQTIGRACDAAPWSRSTVDLSKCLCWTTQTSCEDESLFWKDAYVTSWCWHAVTCRCKTDAGGKQRVLYSLKLNLHNLTQRWENGIVYIRNHEKKNSGK